MKEITSVESVCGRIRTFGALPHTTLAGWHHKPLGHANGKWMGQDSNLRCFFVTDLQSAALAARHTHPWGDQGNRSPLRFGRRRTDVHWTSCALVSRATYLQSELRSLYYHYPMATVAPAGLEPDISGLRGRRPDL